MLNTTNIRMGSSTSNVTLNTPSHGMMQRSHPKSFFINFNMASPLASYIFNTQGKQSGLIDRPYKHADWKLHTEVEVMQIMVFGDNQFLCEVVRLTDLKEEVV